MSREFYVPCQPYAYPLRSSLAPGVVSGRLKSLVKWRGTKERKPRVVKGGAIAEVASSSEPRLDAPVAIGDDPFKRTLSEAGNNPNSDTNASHIESQENKSGAPQHNLIESNHFSSSFDPGTSSFTTADSVSTCNAGELASNEDNEVTSTTFVEEANSATTNVSDSANLTNDIVMDILNPRNVEEPFPGPSVVIGRQIPTTSMATGVLNVLPILYIQSDSINSSSQSTARTTDESFVSTSSGCTKLHGLDNYQMYIQKCAVMIVIWILFALILIWCCNYKNLWKFECGSGASEGVVSVNGVVNGMDCMPLRPGPFHYLISEQAKSLVALQELQNEVGALLEFRDLVIETFPNLRHKMAVTAAASAATGASSAGNGNASVLMSSSQGSHIPLPLSSQSPSSRRIGEWEPGKVRRRVAQSRENESSSSSLPRSRSNSHSGGNKHSATVQDSGFSTETSSKDSASTAIPRPQSPTSRPVLDEAEDELWNLLDVIHRKGVRLREEVESLQGRLESVAPEELDVPSDILDAVRKVTRHSDRQLDSEDDDLLLDDDDSQVALLRREKLQLLDKVAELEAETISSRARAQELQSELATLSALRNGLEDRLRAGLEAGDGGILAPGAQRIQPIEPTAPTLQSPRASGNALNIRSKDSAFASVVSGGKAHKNRFRTRTIEKNVLAATAAISRSIEDVRSGTGTSATCANSVNERRARLGALDSVLISPTRMPQQMHRGDVDKRKIAAILRERSPLELQRHLITTTVHNQALRKRLDEVEKSSETLSERLGKAHEENEDLRFQLAERNIELEGTRARVRVLERLQQRPATENDADDESETNFHQLHNGHQQNGLEANSSSTESSRETQHCTNQLNGTSVESTQSSQLKPSPRRRPSRIPLLGATKATAPKPPSSGNSVNSAGHRRNDSKDSLKSLTAQKNGSNNTSISSNRLVTATSKTGRDSSRESLNKSSLSKSQNGNHSREPSSRSLPRNNSSSRDSLSKQQQQQQQQQQQLSNGSLSRPRDSLESNGNNGNQASPGTPPRRPPAPARRSQSQATRPVSTNVGGGGVGGGVGAGDSGADTGKSMQSSNPPSSWLSSGPSLYPDSLNSTTINNENDEDEDETSSRTGSTRVEFIIGSPTRKRLFQTPWTVPNYFDSIDTGMMHESFVSDEYPPRQGEALAELDSLECEERLQSDS